MSNGLTEKVIFLERLVFLIVKLTRYALVKGSAEGATKLNAFDNALLNAGVGNLNLVRLSSILPPELIREDSLHTLPSPGSLLPIAYGSITSDIPGELISAAVGIGIYAEDEYGVIMETSGQCGKDESIAKVTAMVEEAFAVRGRDLKTVLTCGVEHRVVAAGCAFAAVPMWAWW